MENQNNNLNKQKPNIDEYLIPYVGTLLYLSRMRRKGIAPDLGYLPKLTISHFVVIAGLFNCARGLEHLLK